MNTQASSETQPVQLGKYGWNGFAKFLSLPIVYAIELFIFAGTLNWSLGWITVATYFVIWLIVLIALVRNNPELLVVRGQPRSKTGAGTKSQDWKFLLLYTILTFVMPIVSGLDFRNSWTGALPLFIPILGVILVIAGVGLLGWSMVVNRYFEGTVRIQEDRGQQVTSSGPYHYVRHPGYTGVILYTFGLALAAGTLVALIPAVLNLLVFIFRTAFEDRTLQTELPGYKEFAAQTKYRLLPGVW